jgi:cytochrome P450
VFTLNDDGVAEVAMDPISEEITSRVLAAVRACPVAAITSYPVEVSPPGAGPSLTAASAGSPARPAGTVSTTDPSPISWSEEHGGYWVVTGYAECRAIAGARTGFSSVPTVHIPPSGLAERGVRIYALESDEPAHRHERAVLRGAVGPASVDALSGWIRTRAVDLLHVLDWSGPVDLASGFAYRLPLDVVSKVVGVPDGLAGELRLHTETLLAPATQEQAEAAADRIIEIATATITARRDHPVGDWLDELIASGGADGDVEDEAVRAVVALITGGHHSTSRALGSLIARIFSEAGLLDALLEDTSHIPAVAEETLRLHTPLPSFSRCATDDHVVGATTIRAGEQILLRYADANVDSRTYDHAEQFDVDRERHEHLAFGWGVHRCVGMHLARAELRIGIEELLRLAPDVRLVAPIHWNGPALPATVTVRSDIAFTAQRKICRHQP